LKLPGSKLFAVDMPKGSFCDCGRQAEIQFVITSGKGEAKRLAAEAKKARSVGSKAPEVGCGLCIANMIVAKELFVTEVLKNSPVKWERIPISTKCLDCGKDLPFGAWAHWHGDTGQAICGDCGVHRGWTDKTLANLHVKLAELKADVVTVRKRYKIEVEGLYILDEKLELQRLEESGKALEKRILDAVSMLESYLQAVATGREKLILENIEKEIQSLHSLAVEINTELRTRLFILNQAECKRKTIALKIFETVDAAKEAELEELRHAEGSLAEVPAE
jgi:hypothetical protein